MKIIFDSELRGHHLEYIHHLWTGIALSESQDHYTFVIPQKEWNDTKHLREWPESGKIHLHFLTEDDLNYNPILPILKRSQTECHLIRNVVNQIGNVSEVIILNLAITMPLLPLFLSKKIKVSGIIYTINLYANFKGLRGIKERFVLYQYSKASLFKKIHTLNSSFAVNYYNNRYATTRFSCLVDPVPDVDFKKLHNLRNELCISEEMLVFLHFGVMQNRKGTLLILKALKELQYLGNKMFIFAGKIDPEITVEFNRLRKEAEAVGARIIIIDQFIDFEYLYNLCYSSDCILAPYLDTACSSGVIGYGSIFGKPIIGSETGLLGELICNYNLGLTIPIGVKPLAEIIDNFKPMRIDSNYRNTNTVANFYHSILG